MIFSYESNEVMVNGVKTKFFKAPAKIYKVVMPKDDLVVLLMLVRGFEGGDDFDKCRNVFAVNDKGEVVWQIEKSPYERPGPYGSGETIPNPFTNIGITKNGQLKAFASSFLFDVDIETGKLSNPEFTK